MKQFRINHYSTFSTKKAAIVERLIRTLKTNLYKHFSLHGKYEWVGKHLESIVWTYNNFVNCANKYKPIDVNISNEHIVKQNIYKLQEKNVKYQEVNSKLMIKYASASIKLNLLRVIHLIGQRKLLKL